MDGNAEYLAAERAILKETHKLTLNVASLTASLA